MIDDHEFQRCGRGRLTDDQACFLVRMGGDAERCHELTDRRFEDCYDMAPLEAFCQCPESAHDIPLVTEAERRAAEAMVQVLSAPPGDVDY